MLKDKPRLLLADAKGRIFAHPDLEATGMKAGRFFRLDSKDLVRLPAGSELFKLPERLPVGYDSQSRAFIIVPDAHAVAAFASPGHVLTHSASYCEGARPKPLPLFAYGACAIYKNEIYVAALKIDGDKRHDSALIDIGLVKKNIPEFERLFPSNRLIRHLSRCAMVHGCPNAQNFFLHRYEAPLPVSPLCNASCRGCISYQKGAIACTQPRIRFTPSAQEVAQVAIFHIANVKDPIVSFGQGCEGEPLLEGKLVKESIRLIRSVTKKGTINVNTNGSRPEVLSGLFDAGLDSARISMNSARKDYYDRYYRPCGYSFSDVVKSIALAKKKGRFVSINYLTMPGFTDNTIEIETVSKLIGKLGIDMIQWRNLNYDPILYFKQMGIKPDVSKLIGIHQTIGLLKKEFPRLKMGYFNPHTTRRFAPRVRG